MARITLEPGERFEHYHDHASRTEHIVGSVDVVMASGRLSLRPGESVDIPAMIPHAMVNVGNVPATVNCTNHVAADPKNA